MARGMNPNGIAVAVAGSIFCPMVRIGDIVEQIRRACIFLWQRFGQQILVCGHSAGGHLAAAMVATDWPALYPKAPAVLVPAGYAISGVFDLAPLVNLALDQDLRLDAAEARRLSPLFWPVPPGRALDTVVGNRESSEFKRQSRVMARHGRAVPDALHGSSREPFYRHRRADRSGEPDGRADRRNGAAPPVARRSAMPESAHRARRRK